MSVIDLSPGHICFGCQKNVVDYEEHLHLDLDEWCATVGEEPIGIAVAVTFCSDCIQKGGSFISESHAISDRDVTA